MNYNSSSSGYRKANNVTIAHQGSQQTLPPQIQQQQQQLYLHNQQQSQAQQMQQQLQQQQQQQQLPPQTSQQQQLHMKPIPHHPGSMNARSGIPQPALMASNSILTLGPFKHRKDLTRESVLSTYQIMGYIAAGTYGKVYKAKLKNKNPVDDADTKDMLDESIVSPEVNNNTNNNNNNNNNNNPLGLPQFYAIKKFKSDNHHHHNNNNNNNGNINNMKNNNSMNLGSMNNNGVGGNNNSIHQDEVLHYTGISQSAIREMSLCRELNNKNITRLVDIILENKSIYMIFEFCEHDLLQIIHYQSHPEFKPIPSSTIKSLIWQILNGVTYLHKNWIFHRDLKPANIMVSSQGIVKIGDLGLARKFKNPLQSLYTGDKVVVTIWYRAPELLLGTRHYSPAIDLWAVGCILAELLSLRPIFKGEEAKIDLNNKKSVPFQKNQLQKIVEILGTPTTENWPNLNKYPEYVSYTQNFNQNYPNNLANWFKMINGGNNTNSNNCLQLLSGLLNYDPESRLTADQALVHPYFLELPKVTENAFEGLSYKYPNRKIYTDDNDIMTGQPQPQPQPQQQQQQQQLPPQSQQQMQVQQNIQMSQVQQMQQQIQSQQLQGYKRSMDDMAGNIRKRR